MDFVFFMTFRQQGEDNMAENGLVNLVGTS